MLNETHDPGLRSWLASAQAPGGDFPIQNLPFAVFRRRGSAGVAGAARESVGVGAPRIGPPRSLECAGGGGYDTSPATPASA